MVYVAKRMTSPRAFLARFRMTYAQVVDLRYEVDHLTRSLSTVDAAHERTVTALRAENSELKREVEALRRDLNKQLEMTGVQR